MYDSVNAWAIPAAAPMVAGYEDGAYAWSEAAWARFPNAIKVLISVGANPRLARVADVERGDYLPWQAVDFVLLQRSKGIDPTVYVNLSNWAPTQTEFRLRGVPEPHWWLALYDGVAVVPPGAVAKQYANSVYTHGNYDLSIVADFWPGVDLTYGPSTGGAELLPDERAALLNIKAEVGTPVLANGVADLLLKRTHSLVTAVATLQTELDQVKAMVVAGPAGSDTAAITALGAKIDRLLAELHTP